MMIDAQLVLAPDVVLDCGRRKSARPPKVYAYALSHLEQSDDLDLPFTRVRQGRKPTRRYLRAAYKIIEAL